MNEKLLDYRQNSSLFFAVCLGLLATNAFAQNGVAFFGNTHIGPATELYVHSYAVTLAGITSTQKEIPAGVLSVSNDAVIGGAGATGYINGFVRSYGTTATTYPVGSSVLYAPVTIIPVNQAALDVAYNDNAFNATAFDATLLDAVSGVGYWDVLGNNSGVLTLSWQEADAVSLLTDVLGHLTIAGWNGSGWVPLEGTMAAGATLSGGTLTTNATIDFTTYSAFTFAKIHEDTAGTTLVQADKAYMFIQNGTFVLSASQDVSGVEVYDSTGRLVQAYTVNSKVCEAGFAHAQGIYIAKAKLTNGATITRKLLNR